MSESLRANGGNVDSEFIGSLRTVHMVPIMNPKKAELEEELHLIADISVVIDLIGQGWQIDNTDSDLTLSFERDASPDLEKDRIRRAHLLDRDAQFTEPSVLQFIRGMEKRRLTTTGWHSIFSLMRDGEQLATSLQAIESFGSEGLNGLEQVIQPYIEFVTPDAACQHTGLRLNDIWRYFRYTWVNSYRSVPGRSMMILIRDAAAPNHPIIGIAALGSSVVQSSVRDSWIGWDGAGALLKLQDMRPSKGTRWVLEQTDRLIHEVYIKDLVRDGVVARRELRTPDDDTLSRLLSESDKAIRQHRLYPTDAKHNGVESLSAREWESRAELPLFRSKRAKHLARLLRIRQTFISLELAEGMTTGDWKNLFKSSGFRSAVGQLIRAVKAERVGINMMDITVCGAIAPYNQLLGGKLVCMLLCSPQVGIECARRYGSHVSIIASAMQGKPVVREARLALLCTTSLYGSALSQYSRVKMPATAAGGKASSSVEYKELGVSEGFGSFHFSKESLRLFDMVVGRTKQGRRVNSIFGEGVNPLMRKIRDAMSTLGLPAEQLLWHGNRRVVYGVSLAENTNDFLSGFDDRLRFLFPHTRVVEKSEEIARYWMKRWMKRRLEKPGLFDAISEHRLTYPIRHGGRVSLPSDELLLDALMLTSS